MEENQVTDHAVSRRSFLTTSGKVLAGAAVASTMLAKTDKAAATPYDTAYGYAQLDPQKVGQIAYENYAKRWCASSVIAGLVSELAAKVGGPWKDYPIDAMRWAHGGFAGWGALCGTLVGAGAVIGLVVKDTDVAEAMTNDLAFFYSYTDMPSFTPPKDLLADINSMTIAGTPVCHISVGRWMRQEGVEFLSNERAERCARVAANIAMETVHMLNAWKEGKYVPKHKPLFNVLTNGITSQNNCMDCHGDHVPSPERTYPTISTADSAKAAPPKAGK